MRGRRPTPAHQVAEAVDRLERELRLFFASLDQSATQVDLALDRQAWLATRRRAAPDTRQEDVEGEEVL
jgi:hypothetical protein